MVKQKYVLLNSLLLLKRRAGKNAQTGLINSHQLEQQTKSFQEVYHPVC